MSIRQFFDKSDYQIIFLTRFVLGFDLPKHIKLSDRSKYIKLSDRSRLRKSAELHCEGENLNLKLNVFGWNIFHFD